MVSLQRGKSLIVLFSFPPFCTVASFSLIFVSGNGTGLSVFLGPICMWRRARGASCARRSASVSAGTVNRLRISPLDYSEHVCTVTTKYFGNLCVANRFDDPSSRYFLRMDRFAFGPLRFQVVVTPRCSGSFRNAFIPGRVRRK